MEANCVRLNSLLFGPVALLLPAVAWVCCCWGSNTVQNHQPPPVDPWLNSLSLEVVRVEHRPFTLLPWTVFLKM